MGVIVHGDLKAANVLVESRNGQPHAKLLDFGLARVLTRDALPLGGSTRWMAPEVFIRAKPSPAADVFALGRLIFLVLTRVMPLAEQNKRTISEASKQKVT